MVLHTQQAPPLVCEHPAYDPNSSAVCTSPIHDSFFARSCCDSVCCLILNCFLTIPAGKLCFLSDAYCGQGIVRHVQLGQPESLKLVCLVRPGAIEELQRIANQYLSLADSTLPGHAHLEAADRDTLRKEAGAALQWIHEKVALQAQVGRLRWCARMHEALQV